MQKLGFYDGFAITEELNHMTEIVNDQSFIMENLRLKNFFLKMFPNYHHQYSFGLYLPNHAPNMVRINLNCKFCKVLKKAAVSLAWNNSLFLNYTQKNNLFKQHLFSVILKLQKK
jgi:hypothetical protein